MIHTAFQLPPTNSLAIEALDGNECPTLLDITPVIHPRRGIHPDHSRTFWSATANAHYIVRKTGEDIFGPMPDFAAKLADCPDLVAYGRRGPTDCDAQGIADMDLWRAADAAALTDRPSAPVAFHSIGWLPTSMSENAWLELILRFLDEEIVSRGMIADWALHSHADGEGGWTKKPHVHFVTTARFWRGPRLGQPQLAWMATVAQRKAVRDAWSKIVCT